MLMFATETRLPPFPLYVLLTFKIKPYHKLIIHINFRIINIILLKIKQSFNLQTLELFPVIY